MKDLPTAALLISCAQEYQKIKARGYRRFMTAGRLSAWHGSEAVKSYLQMFSESDRQFIKNYENSG